MVWAGIFFLAPRLKYFDFSESFFNDDACFKVRKLEYDEPKASG